MCNGFHRESLIIKAFYIHFSSHTSSSDQLHNALHDFLTLRFLPRGMNRDPIEIDGSIIRFGAPAFLTLHRLLSADKLSSTVYGSRDRVKASEGDRFEIYYGGEKVLKGAIRKDEEGNWKLDCKRGLDDDGVDFVSQAYVEVAVDVDGHVALLSDKVEIQLARRRRRGKRNPRLLLGLEEIPEEGELESDGSCCCDCDCGKAAEEIKMDGEDSEMEEMDLELENVRWAVDAAILVVSLGVGFLVSRASCKNLVRQWKLV